MNGENKGWVLRLESDGSIRIKMDALPQSSRELRVLNPTHITCGSAEIQSIIEFGGGRASYPVGVAKFLPTSATLVFMGAPLPNSELIIRHQGDHRDDRTWVKPVLGAETPHSISLN